MGGKPPFKLSQLVIGRVSFLLAVGQRLPSAVHDMATVFFRTIMRDRERERVLESVGARQKTQSFVSEYWK